MLTATARFAAVILTCALATQLRAGELPAPLVYLADIDASIAQDMRYAGSRNFTGRPVPGYESPDCILTRDTARALQRVQAALAHQDYRLKVYDCYRPKRSVQSFMHWVISGTSNAEMTAYRPNVAQRSLIAYGYIAARSTHSTGRAVDLTLVPIETRSAKADTDVPTKTEAVNAPCTASILDRGTDGSIDMGTSFDCFDPKSNTYAAGLSEAQKAARSTLVSAMKAQGFTNYTKEWWHFTYGTGGSKAFDVPVQARK